MRYARGGEPTEAEGRLLKLVVEFVERNGYPPSVHQMRVGLNLGSTNGVVKTLDRLEREGFLRRTRGVARSLVLTEKGRAWGSAEAERARGAA